MGPEGVNLSLSSFKMRSPAWHMVAVYRLIQQPAPFFHLMGGRSHPPVAPVAGCEIVKQLIKPAKRPGDKSRAGHTICHYCCIYHGNPAGAREAQRLPKGWRRGSRARLSGAPSALPLLPMHLSQGGGAPHTQPPDPQQNFSWACPGCKWSTGHATHDCVLCCPRPLGVTGMTGG